MTKPSVAVKHCTVILSCLGGGNTIILTPYHLYCKNTEFLSDKEGEPDLEYINVRMIASYTFQIDLPR